MRLSPLEAQAITGRIQNFLSETSKVKIYLVGSRTRDDLKGGDIDIAVVVSDTEECHQLKLVDYKIKSAIKQNKAIGDQKIDLKIISKAETEEAFYKKALESAELLWEKY